MNQLNKSESRRGFKGDVFGQLARVAKGFAHPRRLELLELLAQGEKPVETLCAEASLGMASASQHLQVLRAAHLVKSRKQGLNVFYRLASDEVFSTLRKLRGVAEAQAPELREVLSDFFQDRQVADEVDRQELLRRQRKGLVVVVDVRPEHEYRKGHIAGALCIPVAELSRRLEELPRGREVVAYCRGPYCVYADDALRLLRKRGRKARRLREGFPEWRDEGLPVERSAP